jgi:hypothetical protein
MRISISPGKLMSNIVCGEKFINRPTDPNKHPIRTPAIVRTSNKFVLIQVSIYV